MNGCAVYHPFLTFLLLFVSRQKVNNKKLMHKNQKAQVSDTTGDDSSNTAKYKTIKHKQ